MFNRVAFVCVLLIVTSIAWGDTITPQIGGGIGFSFDGGISGKKKASGGGGTCATANGKLDFGNTCDVVYKMGIFQ